MKNRTENISVRYRPQHLTKSQIFFMVFILFETITFIMIKSDRLNHTNIVTTLYDTITFFL